MMTGTAQDPPKIREDFIARWKALVEEHAKPDEENLLATGVGLVEVYLEQPIPGPIMAVEQPMWVPLTDSTGEVLEKPLFVVPDLISSSPDQTLTVHEIKTAARAYSEADVASSLQATCYAHALHEVEAIEPQVEFVVLVKTKTPKLQRITTHRDDADFARLGDLARTVERGITAGVFYPVENPMNCSGCPYFRPCREWTPSNATSTYAEHQLEAAAC
jgi:CRISPR/Cas system-associated exonuclease Cas4 (RecB family)